MITHTSYQVISSHAVWRKPPRKDEGCVRGHHASGPPDVPTSNCPELSGVIPPATTMVRARPCGHRASATRPCRMFPRVDRRKRPPNDAPSSHHTTRRRYLLPVTNERTVTGRPLAFMCFNFEARLTHKAGTSTLPHSRPANTRSHTDSALMLVPHIPCPRQHTPVVRYSVIGALRLLGPSPFKYRHHAFPFSPNQHTRASHIKGMERCSRHRHSCYDPPCICTTAPAELGFELRSCFTSLMYHASHRNGRQQKGH